MANSKSAAARWDVNIADGISGPAAAAASALDDLKRAIKSDSDELAGMERALRNLKRGGAEFAGQVELIRVEVDAKRKVVAEAQLEYIKLGGTFAKPIKARVEVEVSPPPTNEQFGPVFEAHPERMGALTKEVSTASQVFGEFRDGVEKSNTTIGRFMAGVSRLIGRMSGAKLVAVALATAFAAVAGAAAVATKRLFEHAIAAQNARRNEYLHLEALTRRRHLYARTTNDAKAMQASIDRISASVSISRGDVAALAEQLDTAGVRGARFDTILEASAIKASALGQASGSAFAGFATAVGLAGGSFDRAAQDVKNRFGHVVEAKMKSLEVQALKVAENMDSLFAGLAIEDLLTAKKALNDMLSQATASGRALREVMTRVLQPLLDAATDGLVIVRRFFKQLLLGALQMQLAYMTVKLWFVEAFGGGETTSTMTEWLDRMELGRYAAYALAAAIGVLTYKSMVGLAVWTGRASLALLKFSLNALGRLIFMAWRAYLAMGPLLVRMAAFAVQVALAAWPILLVAAAVLGLYSIVTNLYDLWNEFDWSDIGRNLWKGIVGGIKEGWGKVTAAASELADKVKLAFTNALKIHSPSRIFAEYGYQIPAGVQAGIEAGAGGATDAAADMLASTTPRIDAGGLGGRGGGASASRGNVTITIGEIKIGADTESPRDMAVAFRRELESVLAGLAEQLGAEREVPA